MKDFPNVKCDEKLSLHTTFKVGGSAKYFFEPSSVREIQEILAYAKSKSVKTMIVGNGSNLLFSDDGFDGLIIHIGKSFSNIVVNGNSITAQAGATMPQIATVALNNSLSGFEFASGIPGTIGGGLMMNAGAYGSSLSDVVISCECIHNNEIVTLQKADMALDYRTSVFKNGEYVILSVTMQFATGNKDEILTKMQDLKKRRLEKQPLEFPSAGSTFKRPVGNFAGALIEGAGLKGKTIGGASVSEKHAGFIINKGDATAKDILDLIAYVQDEVYKNSGIKLEPEVKIIR